MAEDGEGAIWIAYITGAVSRIQDGKVTSFSASAGLPANVLLADDGHQRRVVVCERRARRCFSRQPLSDTAKRG